MSLVDGWVWYSQHNLGAGHEQLGRAVAVNIVVLTNRPLHQQAAVPALAATIAGAATCATGAPVSSWYRLARIWWNTLRLSGPTGRISTALTQRGSVRPVRW